MLTAGVMLLLIALLIFGMPVAFALGISGAFGIWMAVGFDGLVSQLSSTPYRSVASTTLATIPLFILMAEFMNQGGMARLMFDAAQKLVGRIPGGVAIATVFASAGFGAVSGSSTASSGTIAAISQPEFERLGYDKPSSAGIVAAAGTLAVMIPPSIAMIIYGIMTETSIGKLLISGIIPGIMTTLLYVIGIIIWAKFDPKKLPSSEKFTWKEKIQSVRNLWGVALIIGFIFVVLYGGIATATEVAGVAAMATLVYLLILRRLSWQKIIRAFDRSIRISVMMLTIVMGAMVFGYFLTITRVPQSLIEFISASGLSAWTVLLIIVFIYLVMGVFMESIAIMIITLPLTFPLVTSLGFDPIWFGIVVVKTIEIGLITPPLGMNVFVVSGTTGIPVGKVFRGTGYMLLFELISLLIIFLFPAIATVFVS